MTVYKSPYPLVKLLPSAVPYLEPSTKTQPLNILLTQGPHDLYETIRGWVKVSSPATSGVWIQSFYVIYLGRPPQHKRGTLPPWLAHGKIDTSRRGWFAAGLLSAADIATESGTEGLSYIGEIAGLIVEGFSVAEAVGLVGEPEDTPVEAGLFLVEAVALLILVIVAVPLMLLLVLGKGLRAFTVSTSLPLGLGKISIPIGQIFGWWVAFIEGAVTAVGNGIELLVSDVAHMYVHIVHAVGGLFLLMYKSTIVSMINGVTAPFTKAVSTLWSTVFGVREHGKVVRYGLTHLVSENTTAVTKIAGDVGVLSSRVVAADRWQQHVQSVTIPAVNKELGAVQHEVSVLQHEVAGITGGSGTPAVGVKALAAQVHTLQQQVQALSHRVTVLESRPQHGSGLTTTQLNQLSHDTQVVTQLAPLTALLPLTATMVGNLRKLARDPCYCKGLSLPQSDAMLYAIAADYVLKNGV